MLVMKFSLFKFVFLYLCSCCEETMRASAVLLLAFLAMAFVATNGAAVVSGTHYVIYIAFEPPCFKSDNKQML